MSLRPVASVSAAAMLLVPLSGLSGQAVPGQVPGQSARSTGVTASVRDRDVRAHMEFLASDALQGRGSGTRFEHLAALYIAAQLQQFNIEPGGERGPGASSYLQTVPVKDLEAGRTWNVVGILPGRDPSLHHQAILLSAHLDHLGTGKPVAGDTIYNGADDDASGVTAVLELARIFGAGTRPRRTVLFALYGSEERGSHGSRHFIRNPPVPLADIAANLQFEMIGRPDPKVPPGTLWLTGYDRSDLGPTLVKQGARLVADPHPEERFFERSDNFPLARKGVVAHTVSSFGLHSDYHQPSDDLERIDYAHLTRSINSMLAPIRWLANSDFSPAWLPGKKP